MSEHDTDRRRARDEHPEDRGAEAATMRLPRPRPHARGRDTDEAGEVDSAHAAFARAVHTGVDDAHGGSHGVQVLERTIASLPERDTLAQLHVLRRLASEGHPVMALLHVTVVGTGRTLDVFASELPRLLAAVMRRQAELQASTDPSFEGVTEMPPAQRAELTALARRYVFGGGQTSTSALLADGETLARLSAALPATLDPLAQASLRQLVHAFRQAAFAMQGERAPSIDVDDGRGESVAEHEARRARHLEAGRQIQQGLFAGLLFMVAYERTNDFDVATRYAGFGAAIDGVVSGLGSVCEGREALSSPASRGADGRLPQGPAVVGIDGGDMPAMPQPVHAQPVTEVIAPSSGTVHGRPPRGPEARARSAEHARRLGPGRR